MSSALDSRCYSSVTGADKLALLLQNCLPKSCQSVIPSGQLFLQLICSPIPPIQMGFADLPSHFSALQTSPGFIPISTSVVAKPEEICLHLCQLH